MRLKGYQKHLFLFLLISASILSCKEDTVAPKVDIVGKWDVIEAFRNNHPTSTLQNAYFEFVNDSIMKTNILGTDTETPYRMGSKNKSFTQLSSPPIEYFFGETRKDSIILNTNIQDYSFQFYLARQ